VDFAYSCAGIKGEDGGQVEQAGGKENIAAGGGVKSALEETQRWIGQQVEHVWRALGVADTQEDRKLELREWGKGLEYGFVHKGKLLAKARSYFSFGERQWRFELVQVDEEYYPAVKEYFRKKI